MTSSLPEYLIIIPCLNEENFLEKLVTSLINNPITKNARVIIVDGGSTDKTVLIAQELVHRYPRIILLNNPKRIQAAAINQVVLNKEYEAEFIIRLDAHADYPTNYCQTLIDEYMLTKADSIVVGMQTIGKAPFQKAVAAAQNSKLGNGGSAHRTAGESGSWVDHGHHALMRIDAFRSIGGYDENFAYNEDAELDYRLIKAGYKIWLTNNTFLIYYPRSTPDRLFKQYIGYGYGRAQTILKHHIKPKIRQMIPASIFPIIILALFSPWCFITAIPLIAWLLLCLIYGLFLAYRAKDFCIVMSGPAAMLMHTAWSLGFWAQFLKKAWIRYE